MGLTGRIRHRLDDARWRFRYWWLDTSGGEAAHWAGVWVGVLVVIVQLVRMFVAAALPPPPGEPVKAVYWWVVQLVIAVISAVVSYMMRPKVEPPKRDGRVDQDQGAHVVGSLFGQPQRQRAAHRQAGHGRPVALRAQVDQRGVDLAVPVLPGGGVHLLPGGAVAGQARYPDRVTCGFVEVTGPGGHRGG